MSARFDLVRERIGFAQAIELVDAVHRADAGRIAQMLRDADLPAVVVMLAAMVDEDRRPSDLLAWTENLRVRSFHTARNAPGPRVPAPHGTHASFNRHKANSEKPCDACVIGERQYQRERNHRRRAAAGVAA